MANARANGTLVKHGRGLTTSYRNLSGSVHVMRNPSMVLDGREKAWVATWTDCLGQKREKHFRLLRHVRAWLERDESAA